MIRKGTKKVIPYNNDYEPTKIAKGDKVIFDYEKKTASGKEVSIVSNYKPKPYLEINGEQLQNTDRVPVLSVEGIGLKYNQLVEKSTIPQTTTVNGVTFTNNSDGTITANGTATGSFAYISDVVKVEQGKKYLWLGTPKNGSATTYRSYITGANISVTEVDYGNGAFVTAISSGNAYPVFAYISLGYTANNLVFRPQFICLTDMFGAGNEPTTLEQFYATTQGKLYKSYVEYGYHILGAGEYLSNQLIGSNTISGLSGVSFSNNLFTFTEDVNNKTLLYINGLTVGEKYLISNNFSNEIFGTGKMRVYDNSGALLYSPSGLFTARHTSIIILTINNSYTIPRGNQFYIALSKLTEFGLQDLTLDQLKAQRPDLFVPQPYHTTEKRIGMIFNDGSVDRLDQPLYAVNNDIKDEYKTNGVVVRRTKIENGEVVALSQPIVEHREPIAESRFDTINSIVNEDFTSDEEDTPNPSYPREIEHTSKFKWNDLELPLDLYNGDKIIASRKVGKNLFDIDRALSSCLAKSGNSYIYTKIDNNVRFTKEVAVKLDLNKTYILSVIDLDNMFSAGINFRLTSGYSQAFTKKSNVFYAKIINVVDIAKIVIYANSTVENGTTGRIYIQLEESSTATEYEPYLKDKVWQYKVKGSVDLGELNYDKDSSTIGYQRFNSLTAISDLKYIDYSSNIVCSKYISSNEPITNRNKDKTIAVFTNKKVYILDSSYTYDDATTFKNSLVGTKLVYELAQPQWIDLTDTLGSMLNDLTPNTAQEFSVDNGTLQVDYYKAKE